MKGVQQVNIKLMLDPEDPMRKNLEQLGIKDDPDSQYVLIRKGADVNYIAGKREDQQHLQVLQTLLRSLARRWKISTL